MTGRCSIWHRFWMNACLVVALLHGTNSATIFVATSASGSDVSGCGQLASAPCGSIGGAIAELHRLGEAQINALVSVLPGQYPADNIQLSQLHVTIDGSGSAQLNGFGASRLLNITGSNVTLSGLQFANGLANNSDGGAILASDSSVQVIASTFVRNRAGGRGGAIAAYDTLLSVSNSSFIGNSIAWTVVTVGAADIFVSNADPSANTVLADNVFQNFAVTGPDIAVVVQGGSVWAQLAGSLSVTGCSFGGGGVRKAQQQPTQPLDVAGALWVSATSLAITDSAFTGIVSFVTAAEGGAVAANVSGFTVEYSAFTGCIMYIYSDAAEVYEGGAVSLTLFSPSIEARFLASNFSGNGLYLLAPPRAVAASVLQGGAVNIRTPQQPSRLQSVSFCQCAFTRNFVQVTEGSAVGDILSGSQGGAISLLASAPTNFAVLNCLFDTNAVYFGATGAIQSKKLSGGAIWVDGTTPAGATTIAVTETVFRANYVRTSAGQCRGGAIYAERSVASVSVAHSVLRQNGCYHSGTAYGGGIAVSPAIDMCTINITESAVTDNLCSLSVGGGGTSTAYGAGIWLNFNGGQARRVVLIGDVISGNHISTPRLIPPVLQYASIGAGIYISSTAAVNDVLIETTNVTSNLMDSQNIDSGRMIAAAIYLQARGVTFNLHKCNVSGNVVDSYGPGGTSVSVIGIAIYLASSSNSVATLSESRLQCNVLRADHATVSLNGAVSIADVGKLLIRDVELSGQQVVGAGATALVRGLGFVLTYQFPQQTYSTVLQNVTIRDNAILLDSDSGVFAPGGGLMMLAQTSTIVDLRISGCLVANNIFAGRVAPSVGSGVGLALVGQVGKIRTIIEHTDFLNNTVTPSWSLGAAGAVLISATLGSPATPGGNNATFRWCNFVGNVGGNGGAITWTADATSAASMAIRDSHFDSNQAYGAGGAIFVRVPQRPGPLALLLSRCIFTNNSDVSGAGAVFIEALDSVTIADTTFAANRGSLVGALSLQADAVALSNCRFENSSGAAAQVLQLFGQSVLTTSEVFIAAVANASSVRADARLREAFVNATVACPVGYPWAVESSTIGDAGSCRRCPVDEYDIGSRATSAPKVAGRNCQPCANSDTVGITCNGGDTVEISFGWQGFVSGSQAPTVVPLQCPDGYCCTNTARCPWSNSCAEGRDPTVPLCGACLANKSEVFGGTSCIDSSKCGSGPTIGLFLLSALCLVGFVVWSFYNSPSASGGSFKALLYFLQSADLLLLEGQGAGAVVTGFVLGVFNLRLGTGSSSGAGCLFPMTAMAKLLVPLLVPLVLFLALLVVTQCVKRCPSINFLGLSPSKSQQAFWALALTAFSTVTKATFSILQCVVVRLDPFPYGESRFVLFTAGAVECYNGWQVAAWILLVPLCLSFPPLVFYVARRKSRNPVAAATLRAAYREDQAHFESVLMGRRLIFILLATFIPQPVTRAFVLFGFNFGLTLLHFQLLPYADATANRLEAGMLALLTCLSAILLLESQSVTHGFSSGSALVQGLKLAILSIPMVLLLAVAIQQLRAQLCKSGGSAGTVKTPSSDTADAGDENGQYLLLSEQPAVNS